MLVDLNFLDFEQPVAELEAKVEELRSLGQSNGLDIKAEIKRLEKKNLELTKSIFSNLTISQVIQLARHPQRPYTADYLSRVFTDFDELYGDRCTAKGSSIIGGLARLEGKPVMVIGHQKGRKTQEKLERNFGMCRPECYRRALRLMKMAERFSLPIITFIDTAGAYPGVEAEERNQSEAIARNLFEMSQLQVPIVCTVTGEGGSGGAIALGVGDRTLMLQYSIYSVISPEGCASILWKSADKAAEAAEALGITADRIQKLGLIDQIVKEPFGGAHRNVEEMSNRLKEALVDQLNTLSKLSTHQLLKQRYRRLISYGISPE